MHGEQRSSSVRYSTSLTVQQSRRAHLTSMFDFLLSNTDLNGVHHRSMMSNHEWVSFYNLWKGHYKQLTVQLPLPNDLMLPRALDSRTRTRL